MSEEFQLTILYMMAGLGAFLFVAYLVWFMRHAATFRAEPLLATCAWVSMAGALLCFASVLTMGQLSFTVDTRWGGVQSGWIGAFLGLAGLGIRQLALIQRRRKRARTDGVDGL